MSFQPADVIKEYEKNVDLKKEHVKILLKWVKNQPHLPTITELQAILFLHSCFYKIEDAKLAINNYFTIRTNFQETFESLTEDGVKQIFSGFFIRVLPKQTPEGYIILMFKMLNTDPKKYNCLNHIKLTSMIILLHLHQFGSANGILLLVDMEGASLRHIFRIKIMVVKQMLHLVQEGIPVRMKGIHYINGTSLINTLFSIMKPIMKRELMNLMRFHSNAPETLYTFIPKECLPEDYGGKSPSVQTLHEENLKNLLDNFDFFKWHDAQKVDETKRRRNSK